MALPFLTLLGSTIALVIVTGVFRFEDGQGKVLVLTGMRASLNRLIEKVFSPLSRWHPYMGRGFFRLIMHYMLHSVLRRVLRLLRRIESSLETLIRQNRQVAKAIDAEKRQTHLTAIADHKLETALSPREKQRRRLHL
jgi:hypothetical protein